MEQEIKESLIALLDGIKVADGKVIVAEMKKLDDFLQTEGRSLHPQLVHFLGNRSYAKALLWLQGADNIPAGVCGKVSKRKEGA